MHRSGAAPFSFLSLWNLRVLIAALVLCAGCAPAMDADQALDYGDAPDPAFPTRLEAGPAMQVFDERGEYVAAVVLGECASEEEAAQDTDDCDDGEISQQDGERLGIPIRRTGFGGSGSYWLNVVVDLDQDGAWDPETEWLVRNCEVAISGPPQETVLCAMASDQMSSTAAGWMRMLVSDRVAPESGWDGSALGSPGEALGEVEDHLLVPSVVEADPPTPTPLLTPTPVDDPGAVAATFEDPADDVRLLDTDGNEVGDAASGHRSDISRVELIWQEDGQQRYLLVRVFRNKGEPSNSSAVQVWLVRGQGETVETVAVPFWELHESELRQGLGTSEGTVSYPGLTIESLESGGLLEFRIPESLVADAAGVVIYSFDRVLESDNRGFDRTDQLPLPAR